MSKDNWQEHIESVPGILSGKAIIKGTRLSVGLILGLLADGADEQEVLDSYPRLTKDDVRACLKYARELVEDTRFYRLPFEEHAASAPR